MAVDRLLPTQESEDLLELTREIADKELAPRVEEHERAETYPEGLFATLGEAGLLGLPYPEEVGGGGQPYEVYLQVLEELAARWAAVAVATSVHSLSCFPLFTFGTEEQKQRLPEMLGGGLIGGYSLSEPQAGSDAAALRVQGGEGRRGLPHHRHQGVDHPRRRGRLLRAVRPHRRGLARRLVLPRARAGRGPVVRASPRRRWACTRSPRRRRTGTARCSTPTG